MASPAEQLASSINFGALAKATELKKRLLFTLGALLIYRLGTYLPLPGLDPVNVAKFFEGQADAFSRRRRFGSVALALVESERAETPQSARVAQPS